VTITLLCRSCNRSATTATSEFSGSLSCMLDLISPLDVHLSSSVMRFSSFLRMAVHECPVLRATSRNGMISARPSYQGFRISCVIPKLSPRAEARPTGRAVLKERLGDCDGLTNV
jgi:hypothetical protein